MGGSFLLKKYYVIFFQEIDHEGCKNFSPIIDHFNMGGKHS